MYVAVVQKFTFAISSPDEFLLTLQLDVDFLLAVTLSRPAFSAPHNFFDGSLNVVAGCAKQTETRYYPVLL